MSQTNQIRKHLESGKPITAIEALVDYDCLRLAARICDIRDQGMRIQTNTVKRNGKWVAEYVKG